MGCEGRIWHGDVQGGQSSIPRSAFGRTSVPRVARSQRGARETSLGTMGLRSPSRSLARSLTRGSVPGRDSGQVTRGLLLLPTGGGGEPGACMGLGGLGGAGDRASPALGQQTCCRDYRFLPPFLEIR